MLQVFRLDRRQELDFFSKDGVPRWVEFRVNMEAPPATRVVILSPPPPGSLEWECSIGSMWL